MNSCLNMLKSLRSVFVIWMILHNIYHLMVKLYQGRRLWSMRESWPRFSSCLQGKGSAMLNKQIRNYLDKVTKAHVIGLMLDDRWMYQKIEGCLLPLQRLPEFQSFSPPLTKTYCKMSRAMPSMMGTSLAYHIIGYKPHEGNIWEKSDVKLPKLLPGLNKRHLNPSKYGCAWRVGSPEMAARYGTTCFVDKGNLFVVPVSCKKDATLIASNGWG